MTQDTLRSRLIMAGLEILQEKGLAALTLRACAARVGVSHAAPAHHFSGLPGLLAGIIAKGFTQFADTMEEDRNSAEQTPIGRLCGLCNGYMRFSREHPALFTLMFNTSGEVDTDDPAFCRASDRAYNLLHETCTPYLPVSPQSAATEVLVWALVHGLATLQHSGRIVVTESEGETPTIEDLLRSLPLKLHT